MDYNHILGVFKTVFKDNHSYIIADIKDCISRGTTGGEISVIVGHYLKNLKIENPSAYHLVEKEIHTYLFTCKKNGLEIF